MIIISISLLVCGILLGSGITLAITRRRQLRIEAESWDSARRFYTRVNPDL